MASKQTAKEGRAEAAATDREGEAKGGGIFGALGSVKNAIKDKVMPTTTKEEQVAAGMEETPVSAPAASTFKKVDHMSGQTFNDVGKLDEEGVGRVRLVRKEKM